MAKTKLLGNDRKEKLDLKERQKINEEARKAARILKDVLSNLKSSLADRQELVKCAGAVLAFIIVLAIIVRLMDFGFKFVVRPCCK